MREKLRHPPQLDGDLWTYRFWPCRNPRHHHVDLEFNLVTHGEGLYLLKNGKYEIRRGDLLWLFPAQEHHLIEHTSEFEMWIGYAKPHIARRLAATPDAKILREQNPAGDYCRHLSPRAFAALERVISEVSSERNSPTLFNAGLPYVFLKAWQLFGSATEMSSRVFHPAVDKAVRLLRQPNDPGSLNEIARQAGLSPHRLSRLFKKQIGLTLVDFRNRQRVERFFQLFGTGHHRNMIHAALDAGFGSYPQFYRVFKSVTGMTPAEYGHELKNGEQETQRR